MRKIKLTENELQKYVKQQVRKQLAEIGVKIEDINELSPALLKKAAQTAREKKKGLHAGRKDSSVHLPDPGPIEKKLEPQSHELGKGSVKRSGNPFYDPEHPEYEMLGKHKEVKGIPPEFQLDKDEYDKKQIAQMGLPEQEEDIDELYGWMGLDATVGDKAKQFGKDVKNTFTPGKFGLGASPYEKKYQKLEPDEGGFAGHADKMAYKDMMKMPKTNSINAGEDMDEYWVDKGTDEKTGQSLGGYLAKNHPMDLGKGFDFSKEADQPGKIKKAISKVGDMFAEPKDTTHHDSRPGSFYALSHKKESFIPSTKEVLLGAKSPKQISFKSLIESIEKKDEVHYNAIIYNAHAGNLKEAVNLIESFIGRSLNKAEKKSVMGKLKAVGKKATLPLTVVAGLGNKNEQAFHRDKQADEDEYGSIIDNDYDANGNIIKKPKKDMSGNEKDETTK